MICNDIDMKAFTDFCEKTLKVQLTSHQLAYIDPKTTAQNARRMGFSTVLQCLALWYAIEKKENVGYVTSGERLAGYHMDNIQSRLSSATKGDYSKLGVDPLFHVRRIEFSREKNKEDTTYIWVFSAGRVHMSLRGHQEMWLLEDTGDFLFYLINEHRTLSQDCLKLDIDNMAIFPDYIENLIKADAYKGRLEESQKKRTEEDKNADT